MKKLQITETQKEVLEAQAANALVGFILAGIAIGAIQLANIVTEVKVELADIIPTPD